jgi:AcrR family transcriptional regulator
VCFVCFKQTYYVSFEDYTETQIKVLVAAESLFAEYGFHGVSLRQITTRANVNLAAVNYHHSDKQSLYGEILTSRLRQLCQARLAKLMAAEAGARGAPVPLDQLITILAATLLLPDEPGSHGPAGRRLLGRSLVEPLPFTATILADEFQPTMTRWGQAVRRHAPGVTPTRFLWQLSFVVGALHHAAASLHDMTARTSGICRNNDAETALENFHEFAVAAFTANSFR